MTKGLFTFLGKTFDNSKYWKDLNTTLTKYGTVIKKSLHKDGDLFAVTKTYSKGSHMADLGVKETRLTFSKISNNLASPGNKPYFIRDGLRVTLNNGKILNLTPDDTKTFFIFSNTYKNYMKV